MKTVLLKSATVLLLVAFVSSFSGGGDISKRRYRKGHYHEKHSKKNSEDCDEIILANGEIVKGKVSEIGIGEIKYKDCANLNGPTISLKRSEVFMIRYPNGTKTVITKKSSSPESEDKSEKTNGKAIAALVCGIFALVGYYFAIPAAIVAVILGRQAMKETINNPEKGKGYKMAKTGMVLGIVGCALWAVVLLILLL